VPGKKTIVLLSTGVDTSPDATLVPPLQTGDVRILCVSMSGPLRNGKEGSKRQVQQTAQAFDEADALLKAIAEATGGRVYFPENAKAFQETYRQVAQLVRHEYNLAFAPPARDGSVHAITVKVDLSNSSGGGKMPDYRVDHRKAYVAPKEPI
jgi:Ca-activated chloride channel homolog